MSVSNDMLDYEENESLEEVPLTKPKKPRTEKQIAAYEKMMSKRSENIKKRNEQKILEQAKKISMKNQHEDEPSVKRKPKKVVYESDIDSSSSSEEEIIYKKKRKPKSKPVSKKQKKKVVYYSSSETETDSSSEEETKDNVSINRNVGYNSARNYFV
jgi:hypothetical protein